MKKGLPAFLTGFTIFENFFFDFSSSFLKAYQVFFTKLLHSGTASL
jgi:hypothetical protein